MAVGGGCFLGDRVCSLVVMGSKYRGFSNRVEGTLTMRIRLQAVSFSIRTREIYFLPEDVAPNFTYLPS
jgi:hypothetical protein